MLGGYRLAGPFRSDNLPPFQRQGEISQGIYQQKMLKSEGHYNVIASYPAAPKVAEIEYCSLESRYGT